MMSYLQGQNFQKDIGKSETTPLEEDSNGALSKWRIKAGKVNVYLEDDNQRKDDRAHLGRQDIERSMDHIRDVALRGERYEATTS